MSPQRQLDPEQPESGSRQANTGEEGFMLLAVVVMVFLVLIALTVAAPVVARQLRRDKEVESRHRMEQYVRAIELYQRKFPGQYPPSIKALEQSNNIRFLRHVYVDPLTGKADYKLIHQGEQKTKIHVFFGKELDSMSGGLGSAAGMQSGGGVGASVGGASGASGSAFGSPMGGGSTSVSSTNALNSGFGGATIGSTGSTGSTGLMGSNSGGMFGDSGGSPIVGVGTSKTGTSVTQPNGQTTYETWEFWYDPAIEQLKQGVNITGGGTSSQSASSFGQNGVTGQPNSGAAGSTGSTGSNGFGSDSFGSSGFGSSNTGSTNSNGSANSNGSTNSNGSAGSPTSNPF